MNDSDHQFELNNWNPELVINEKRILNTTQVEGGGLRSQNYTKPLGMKSAPCRVERTPKHTVRFGLGC